MARPAPKSDIPDILYFLADPENWNQFGFVVTFGERMLAHEFIADIVKKWEYLEKHHEEV